MSPDSVLSKTQKGAREIETREHKLDHRLRTLLIMVNGKASAGELAGKFQPLGDVMPLLNQLAAQGFVQVTGAAAPGASGASAVATPELKQAQVALATQLRNALGPDADVLTAKVEACKSMADLRAWVEGNRQMLDEWLGKSKSAQFWAKAGPLLR